MRRPKTVTFKSQTFWQVEHAGLLIKRKFERAIDAWQWAEWNYKGRAGWRLRVVEQLEALTPSDPTV